MGTAIGSILSSMHFAYHSRLSYRILAWSTVTILLAIASESWADPSRTPAFPGAEGFGKYAEGGRGGAVYHVTNLKDSGPGSLRHGIKNSNGPTTIVFDVSGTLTLKSPLLVENKSHLTIAGQSSPGKGITLRDHNVTIKDSKHIIVRYLRIRLGDENKKQGLSPDVMTVNYNDHLILDHLSLSWGIDGNSDYRGNSNMTLQWLIYSEALNSSLHHKGPHAMATSLRDCFGNTTLHHNIYSTSRNRHPTLGSGVKKGGANWIVDFRNCVNFNWRGETNLGGLKMNVVGNYYRPGPSTRRTQRPFRMKDHDTTLAKGFASGNIFDEMPIAFNEDNYTAITYTNEGGYMSTTRQRWEAPREFDCGEFAIPLQDAQTAYEICLKHSGCSRVRDTVDNRVIRNIRERKGTVIDSQNDVGGWDRYESEHRPAEWDKDRDGIADTWEREHGLNPDDPDDRNHVSNAAGYTNLELYLNSLCPNPRDL